MYQSEYNDHLFLPERFVFGGSGSGKQAAEAKDEQEKKEDKPLTPEEQERINRAKVEKFLEFFKETREAVKIGKEQLPNFERIAADFELKLKEALKDDAISTEELKQLDQIVYGYESIWDLLRMVRLEEKELGRMRGKKKGEKLSEAEEQAYQQARIDIALKEFQERAKRVPEAQKKLDRVNRKIGETMNDEEISKEEMISLVETLIGTWEEIIGPFPKDLLNEESKKGIPETVKVLLKRVEDIIDTTYLERANGDTQLKGAFIYEAPSGETPELVSAKVKALDSVRIELSSVYSEQFQSELARNGLTDLLNTVKILKGSQKPEDVQKQKDEAQKILRRAKDTLKY